MMKKISIGLTTLGAAAVGAYALFIRPWHLHWGATAEEVYPPLPGDAWTPHPKMESTHAITIQPYRNPEFFSSTIPGARLLSFETGGHAAVFIEQEAVGSAVQQHILANAGEPHTQVPAPVAVEVRGES